MCVAMDKKKVSVDSLFCMKIKVALSIETAELHEEGDSKDFDC